MLYKDIRISDVAKRKQIGLALKYISVSPILSIVNLELFNRRNQ